MTDHRVLHGATSGSVLRFTYLTITYSLEGYFQFRQNVLTLANLQYYVTRADLQFLAFIATYFCRDIST